jgi:hypothetical protein
MRTRSFKKAAFFALATIASSTLCLSVAAQSAGSHWNSAHSNGFGATIHGNPPSVTSFGFGGHPGFHGAPPSVTSLNFGNSPVRFNHGIHQGALPSPHRHRHSGFYSPFYGNVVAVPYADPLYVTDPGVDDSMEEEDYRGGPTIFDRRGPGTSEYATPEPRDYREPSRDEDYRTTAPAEPAPQPEVADQPRTVLVFKDGRQLEISNYAIVGSTLYDLSDGRARKVGLAELDLPATLKQNDDRGVDFQLPAETKHN